MPKGNNKLDLINQRFGRLVVVKTIGRTKAKKVLWECKCDCGNTTKCISSELKSRHTKSCGCLRKDAIAKTGHKNRGKQGQEGLTCLYATYKYIARKRNLCFELSKKLFEKLTQQPCFYCGKFPNSKHKGLYRGDYEIYIYNGLDRVDNKIGYTESNVVPCCKRCNMAKNNQSLKSFFEQIKSIYEKHELYRS